MADRHAPSESTASTTLLPSKVDPTSAKFEANMRFLAELVSQVRNEEEKIAEGGGEIIGGEPERPIVGHGPAGG